MTLASSAAFAQSNTTGSIFGQVASHEGNAVVITSDTGLTRTVQVDENGRYRFNSLPAGKYSVSLQNDGKTVSSRDNILVTISAGSEVSFGAGSALAKNLEGVQVIASSLPAIDVSSVDTRTVLTSEQLSKIPVARGIGAAALLAPGVVENSSYSTNGFGNIPSFGGSASSENAYYINGYAVTNPLTSLGSTTLPFDAIDQEQVLTGGYGAEFGRSTGGVINIVTKRGSNQWHGGAYVIWRPEGLRANPRNNYFPNTGYYPKTDGTLYWYRNKNQYTYTTYGAYVSGPLIKDKLFFYLAGEQNKQNGNSVASFSNSTTAAATGWNSYGYKLPRWTAKVDWNITDQHILELTGVSDKVEYDSSRYPYSYTTLAKSNTKTGGVYTKDGGNLYIAKYTGYITDDLTISALYGRQTLEHVQKPFGYVPNCPFINTAANHSTVPGVAYPSCQETAVSGILLPGSNDKTHGYRLDIEYRLGEHDLRFGMDDQTAESLTGSAFAGGYSWVYNWQADPSVAIDSGSGVASPASAGGYGTQGYFVSRAYNTQAANVKTEQAAQFIEDRWQISDRWFMQIGLRNEQFTNFNGDGKPYARQRHQLAPRIGATWDVFGDSTLKVFANAGRYHLAMPNNVAVRGASGSLITNEYFTYTGVDSSGNPTGLTAVAVDKSKGRTCPGGNAVSTNLECGQSRDPRLVAAKGLKAHFQDEYIAGMEQQLSSTYNWGAKLTYRNLRSAIDDTCAQVLGGECFIFNPGVKNTFVTLNPDGSYKETTYTNAQLGFPKLKRQYYALDMFIEHQMADRWYGRIDYTFSRSYGNTEGQLASDLDTGAGGQADVSTTQDWDLPQLMVGANGVLPNDRTHQLKAFGYFQLTPEWRFGGNALVQSGRPRNCTSHYPTADAGLYSGAAYWFCGLSGSGTAPGSTGYKAPAADYAFSPRGSHGRAPWSYSLNLNAAYTPNWLDNKLTFQMDIFNVLNRQVATTYNFRYETSARNTPNSLYLRELNVSEPRYFRFTVRYDF
nr:TonB-dependent receptor [Dyella soli]